MTGRFIAAGLVALSIGPLGLGSRNALAQDGYSSPFSIALDPAITTWTSDFSARQTVIGANTTPPMAVWYSSTTSYAGYPYGPLNPQLFSSGVVLAVLGLVVAGVRRHRGSGRGMRRRRHDSWASVLFSIVAAAPCWAQVASPPEPTLDVAVQEGPGEGDEGESESINEAVDAKPYDGPYRSPYRFAFEAPLQELLFDADEPRGSPREQSSVPFREWYTAKVRHEWGSWGVPTRRFDCPARVMQKPAEWRRERVVAAAGRFIGYQYQHHHVPDWNPPAGWPWKQCCAGHNGPGIDCSNFSGWNYNWALGIHLKTGIQKQAAAKSARSSQGEVHAHVIERPGGEPRDWYDALVEKLRPGDLLYIGNKSRTKVTHVIMWVGTCGSSPNGTPLIIDSTGSSHKDSNGHAIPCGIHLRPFEKGSWYHESFNHAHRWVQ